MAIEILTTEQHEAWDEVLRRTRHDFYFLADYHRLAEERGEGQARLYAFDAGGYTIALPLLLRPIQSVDGLGDEGAGRWDATSVYGYGGPACSHPELPPAVARAFREELAAALADSQVVAAFSRMHPLLMGQADVLGGLGEVLVRWQTVSIDLTETPEAQLAAYRENHRRDVRRLRRDGLQIAVDQSGEYLDVFIDMYAETMRRVGASAGYFFEQRYFERLMADRQTYHLLVAIWEGEVVSGALFGLCDGICQYHLGATRDRALRQAPIKLLFDEARLWAAGRGARVLHLGGGQGREDSLFQFKAGFSSRRHDFAIWRWVAQPDVYAQLVAVREGAERQRGRQLASADFFPRYRSGAVALT